MQRRSHFGNDTHLSKTLSWLLRHGAVKQGLNISPDGYVPVVDILNCQALQNKFTLADIKRVVESNDKKRFTLRENEEGALEIKANQGHSLECVPDLELQPITNSSACDYVIHGTYFKNWHNIKADGLSRMNRLHIHFTSGLPGDTSTVSGMRSNVDLYIYINLEKALKSNIKFYKSPNGVILSSGNEDGVIEPKYFLKVCDARNGLPNVVPKEKIVKFFNDFGSVKDIHIGDGNKFAIIEYSDETIAQMMLKKRHMFFMGKMLQIKPRIVREQADKMEAEKPDEDFEIVNESLKEQTDFKTQVQILLKQVQPSQELQIQKYKQLCYDLERALQETFPGCRVYPFGSTITGLNFKNSDVDVYVERKIPPGGAVEPEGTQAHLVKKAKSVLPKTRMFANVFAIPKAKTPIVKCVHVLTNVSCDFNFKNMLGVCNSYLIRYYLDLDPNLRRVVMLLKYWGKVHEMSGNNGRFTNYALTMMLIFYLQQEPYLLPTVSYMQLDRTCENMQEGWNGGFKPVLNVSNILRDKSVQEVLQGFFGFYASFDFNLNVICPYLGKVVPKMDFLKVESLPDVYLHYKINIASALPLQVETPICIQDPFEHNHNLTKAVSNRVLEDLVSLCKLAAVVLKCSTPKNNVLYRLFTSEPEQDKVRCTEQSCEFKVVMGSAIAYLEQKLSPNADDKSAEMRKLWYDTVNQFMVTVLIKVLRFDVRVKKEEVTTTKSQRIEGQSDIHEREFVDSVTFHCKGRQNLWEARKAIARDLDFGSATTILDKQIYITDYICDVLCKNIIPTEPVVEFNLRLNAKATPIQVEFALEKVSAKKGRFKTLGLFFASRLPHWFNVYEKELNDTVKRLNEGDDSAKV